MTDRELLELAAKAAGMMFDPTVKNKHGLMVVAKDAACQSEQFLWNPLTDSGQALELAVKLRHELGTDVAQCFGIGRFDEYKNDPLAATRRAIVRAAAEIGRSKE